MEKLSCSNHDLSGFFNEFFGRTRHLTTNPIKSYTDERIRIKLNRELTCSASAPLLTLITNKLVKKRSTCCKNIIFLADRTIRGTKLRLSIHILKESASRASPISHKKYSLPSDMRPSQINYSTTINIMEMIIKTL